MIDDNGIRIGQDVVLPSVATVVRVETNTDKTRVSADLEVTFRGESYRVYGVDVHLLEPAVVSGLDTFDTPESA